MSTATQAPLMKRLISLRKAAKANGRGYRYMKALVEQQKLRAFVVGHQTVEMHGRKTQVPALGVLPEEARAAVEREMEYVPEKPKAVRRAGRPALPSAIHPKVKC